MGSGGDGLVSVFSQSFPRGSRSTAAYFHSSIAKKVGPLQPGVWNVFSIQTHHLGVVPFPPSIDSQRAFFERLFTKLARLSNDDNCRFFDNNHSRYTNVLGDGTTCA